MKNVIVITTVVLLSGCSSLAAKHFVGNAVGDANNTQVGYGNQCFVVQSQCTQGIYEEWQTSDGVDGCSCKNL